MAIMWIPEFSYFEYKVKNPIKLGPSLKYIGQKISEGEPFKSLETLFWSTMLLDGLNKLESLDKETVKNYIKSLKHENGGYKYSKDFEEPNIWSTFYCIAILKTLRINEIIDEKDLDFILNSQILGFGSDGGFIHCTFKKCHLNCKGKTSIKSTFFAISALSLLDKLDRVDKKRLSYHLKKDTKDNIELIYQILSSKLVNELNNVNLEKKLPIITSWQLPKSGFGINSKFPTVEHTFWVGICLSLIEQSELINFSGVIDFLKGMQQDNGGFTSQYTSISSKKPDFISTAQGIIALFYFWNKIIEEIENEILKRCKDFSEVYLFPITEKFSMPLNLIEEIVNWLISNKWIDAEILDRQDIFQKYFGKQNKISQEIISKVMKRIQSFQKQKVLDLKEFSKEFDFSNALERVKLVINDLLINKFIIGNIRTHKKKYFLEDYRKPGKYILVKKPIPYDEIMDEKKRLIDDKQSLVTYRNELIEFPQLIFQNIQELIEKEKIDDATKRLNELYEKANNEIAKLEKLMEDIKSSYKFLNFSLSNFKFQHNWPSIKKSIQASLSSTKTQLEQIIKQKKEYISKRTAKEKERDEIKALWGKFTEFKKKLNLYQVEIRNFFPKNYLDHEATLDLLENISNYMEESDSILKSKLTELSKSVKFDQFKKELDNLKSSWRKELDNKKKLFDSYKIKIDKRIQIGKLIKQLTSELDDFSNNREKEINEKIEAEKLDDASNLLNEYSKKYKELVNNQKESFKIFIEKTIEEIPDFQKYSNDLESTWDAKLKEEEKRWEMIKSNLSKKLYSSQELEKKEELEKIIKEKIEDCKHSIENMKNIIIKLVKDDNIIDAGKKTKELNASIEEKIKTYNQEYKDFIKISSREFKNFKETVSDLTENWDKKREALTKELEKTINDLREIINKKGSSIRKLELKNLIMSQNTEIQNKIDKFKQKYNQYIESGKKLEDHEQILINRLSRIDGSIRTSDERIRDFIKTASRIYDTFEDTISEEIALWEESKSKIEKKFNDISEEVQDEILIERIQTVSIAFKDNKVDLNYLSKAVKFKTEPLKMKIIDLISDNKLIGELDPHTDMFILKDERRPKPFTVKKEVKKELGSIKEEDPIRREILNYRYLMVIHNNIGATVYNRKLGEWELDPDLIGGFLTAIQSFGSEIKKEKETIKSMEYKGFGIVMEQGEYVLTALFIDGKESDWTRKKVKQFVKEFEKEFGDALKDWKGEVATFKKSGFLVDKVFELFRV
ncbi:MAG: prenyltransferase/squalene oxidase repeat-containing protein [Candidatus Helarchaeota archaeon]